MKSKKSILVKSIILIFSLFFLNTAFSQQKVYNKQQVVEDVKQLKKDVSLYYPNTAKSAKDKILYSLDSLVNNSIFPLSDRQLKLSFARIIATLNDGHSGIYLLPVDSNYKIPPIDIYYIEDKLIMKDAQKSEFYEIIEYNNINAKYIIDNTLLHFCGERKGFKFNALKQEYLLNYYIQYVNGFNTDSTELLLKKVDDGAVISTKVPNYKLEKALGEFAKPKEDKYFFQVLPDYNTVLLVTQVSHPNN